MNANELAKKLEKTGWHTPLTEIATMLRQQQAEIEALKEKDHCCPDCGCHFVGEYPFNYEVKELTDKEIKFIAYPFESVYTTYDKQTDTVTVHTRFDKLGFARAILRKARGK